MADDCTPGLQNPLNYQSQEKPYYDNGDFSAPIPQNFQPNYYPNQNNYQNYPTVNPGSNTTNTNNYEQPYYVNNNANTNNQYNYNNFIPNEPQVPKKLLRKQLMLGILLLICTIIDATMQLVIDYVNPFAMGDDACVLIISSVFLLFSYKKKLAKNILFGFFVGFVWFVGFGCKGFGMQYIFKDNKINGALAFIPIIYFGLIVGRTFGLFFSIPLSCEGQ